jgi:RimJ/RimL family protein N-acetyltransferase
LYTAPATWGRGAGLALLAAAVEALREDEFTTVTLWTATDNHRPRRIYERAGWRLDGATRNRNLGGIAFEELRYRLRL